MTNIEALDVIFSFIPPIILKKLKQEGFYLPILEGKTRSAAEFYDFLSPEHAAFQDADYYRLAAGFSKILLPGLTLQIGCGRGSLLEELRRLGHAPLIGVDRSPAMLAAAKIRLADFPDAKLIESKAEDLSYQPFWPINNIIIHNFWGLLAEVDSARLLDKLKPSLTADSQIIIGEYAAPKPDALAELAKKTLKEKLDFTFSYPFFQDFARCGYKKKLITINGLNYFLLHIL